MSKSAGDWWKRLRNDVFENMKVGSTDRHVERPNKGIWKNDDVREPFKYLRNEFSRTQDLSTNSFFYYSVSFTILNSFLLMKLDL